MEYKKNIDLIKTNKNKKKRNKITNPPHIFEKISL